MIAQLKTIIYPNLPALQVIIPLLGAIVSGFIGRNSRYLIFPIVILSFMVSLALFLEVQNRKVFSYAFGEWEPPFGIEFRVTSFNGFIALLINIIMVIWLIGGSRITFDEVGRYIKPSRQGLLCSLILIFYTGFLGISMTGDLFNLYVFLEISSLASYSLLSLGKDKKSAVSALEYLIVGTIGATFILISIGLLFSVTGSLNILDIKNILPELKGKDHLIFLGAMLYVVGALLKVAPIPLHSWLVKSYSYAPASMLSFIAPISNIIGAYIIIKFLYFIFDFSSINVMYRINSVLEVVGLLSIILGALFAWAEEDFRRIMIFTSVVSSGYICIFLSIATIKSLGLLIIYIFIANIAKSLFFLITAFLEEITSNTKLKNIEGLAGSYPLLGVIIVFNLLSYAGLPLTAGFLNKLWLLKLLADKALYFGFAIIVLGTLVGVYYNYQVINSIYFGAQSNITIKPMSLGLKFILIAFTAIPFVIVFKATQVLLFASEITKLL